MGFDNQTKDARYVPYDAKLKQELVYVGDVLNLKESKIHQKMGHFESVPLSVQVKIYNYLQPESQNIGKEPDTPTKKSQDFHFSELQYLEEPYYVVKTSEIFPYDCDLNEVNPRKDKYLRPEFICSYERPLKADARKDFPILLKEQKAKDDEVLHFIIIYLILEWLGRVEWSVQVLEADSGPKTGEFAGHVNNHPHRQREFKINFPQFGREPALPGLSHVFISGPPCEGHLHYWNDSQNL